MTVTKRVRWLRLASRTLAVVLFATVLYLVAAPTGRYLLRAAWEEGKILARRRPITALTSDSTTASALRAKLQLVLAARAFAQDSLGLRTGESFTTYSRLDRDTLVLVVSAAYRDQLKPYSWWFPVVGRVPYKGYFDFIAAQRAVHDLTAQGFDARAGAASAFSTLGWFNDPLLPTTLRTDSLTLANTVIHELTHNSYYAPGGAVFNESFANFVGSRGAERFFRTRGWPSAADEVVARWEDEKVMSRFWAALYAVVDSTFHANPGASAPEVARRIALRDSIFGVARQTLVHEVGPRLKSIRVPALEHIRLDNAILLARRVYLTDVDAFDAVLDRDGGDLRRAIAEIIAAAKADRTAPFEAVKRLAQTGAVQP